MLAKFCILITLPCLFAIRDNGLQTFNGNSNSNNNNNRQNIVRYSEPDTPRAPPSAILTHKQGLTNDGVFNYIFAADNGLKQGESIAPDGTRTGAYEYIDPSGKTIFVKYMAGKDGFKILEGDHIPLQPQAVEPIPEFQSPEHRKDYKQPKDNRKYQTDTQDYQEDGQYKPRNQQYQQPQNQQYQQPQKQQYQQQRNQQQNQRNTNQKQQYQQQAQLFQPSGQNKAQGGQGRQNNDSNRAMLYNVEQRHNVNYRKYQDNGQPLGSSDDGSAANQDDGSQKQGPHSYGRGYNFEFQG